MPRKGVRESEEGQRKKNCRSRPCVELWANAMSEFKFACPFCGQHITADSQASGTPLECPTCFQKLIVPQAPTADSKFILSAAKANKSRPMGNSPSGLGPLQRSSDRGSFIAAVLLALLVCAGALTLYVYRQDLLRLISREPGAARTSIPTDHGTNAPTQPHTNGIRWTLDLNVVTIPNSRAAGKIHGNDFCYEMASLTGGTLSLRQGKQWPPELAVAVLLSANQSEQLSGKSFAIPLGRNPPVPTVIVRWKDTQQQPQKLEVTGGYALQVSFGQATNGRMAGKIYLAVPDDSQTVVAGTFDAEIKPMPPPKTVIPAKQ
jgi:hypothetical protein